MNSQQNSNPEIIGSTSATPVDKGPLPTTGSMSFGKQPLTEDPMDIIKRGIEEGDTVERRTKEFEATFIPPTEQT